MLLSPIDDILCKLNQMQIEHDKYVDEYERLYFLWDKYATLMLSFPPLAMLCITDFLPEMACVVKMKLKRETCRVMCDV